MLGFRLSDPSTQRGLYILTVLALTASYMLCRWIVASRAGKVLIAIRDSESRVTFSGYTPWMYKLFVFVVAAGLAGLSGMLYVPQVGIITPAQIGVLPSLEVVIWVAVGGRDVARLPGVGRVAPGAAQVAAREADEQARPAAAQPLALDAVENLADNQCVVPGHHASRLAREPAFA